MVNTSAVEAADAVRLFASHALLDNDSGANSSNLAGSGGGADHVDIHGAGAMPMAGGMMAAALPALVLFASVVVGALSVALAALVLRHGNERALLRVPAAARCAVSGLLAGLGLLIMLPTSLDVLHERGWEAEHVLPYFCAAPVVMFFVHHVILDHQHAPILPFPPGPPPDTADGATEDPSVGLTGLTSHPLGCDCEVHARVASSFGTAIKPQFCGVVKSAGDAGSDFHFRTDGQLPQFCVSVKDLPAVKDDDPGDIDLRSWKPSRSLPSLATACKQYSGGALEVALRALPFTTHAALDGAILATAHSATLLIAIALPIILCTVQDVGVIVINLSASGASQSVTLITVALFGIGFPLGSALTLALTAPSATTTGGGGGDFLLLLRAFAGGVFIYMALFELAPPHTHGRLANLRYVLAFTAGLVVAYLTEEAEAWATSALMRLF